MYQSIYGLVADFYGIKENLAMWLGQISLVLLALVLFPFAFLSDFVSVRKVVMTSCILVSVGSFLKTLAALPLTATRDLFPLLMFGQAISQIPRAITLPYAGRLANLMLKSDEIARGVSIGTSGQTLGLGLGYLLPAVIVTNQHVTISSSKIDVHTNVSKSENSVESEIDYDLMNMELFWLNLNAAIASLIILIGICVLYRSDPLPLNFAERRRSENLLEIKSRRDQFIEFLKTYKNIFKNLHFILLLVSFMLIHG